MPRQFRNSVFRRPAKPDPAQRREDKLVAAYEAGRRAARMDKLFSENPYRPSEEDLYQAWSCGYQEEDLVYVVAASEETAQ